MKQSKSKMDFASDIPTHIVSIDLKEACDSLPPKIIWSSDKNGYGLKYTDTIQYLKKLVEKKRHEIKSLNSSQ